jgi:methyl-accepting chemotaxis protein
MFLNKILTLRWKITLGVIIASVLSVILASIIFVTLEKQRISDSMTKSNQVLAEVVAGNALGAITFGDNDSATSALETFKANPSIIGAVIFDADGGLFANYSRDKSKSNNGIPAGFPSKPVAQQASFESDYLQISYDITEDDEKLGNIYLQVDLSQLDSAIATVTQSAALICLLVAGFSAALSFFIQKNITKPIKTVVTALQDIAEGEGDLTRRLSVTSDDEIGELARWFNIFVDKIHSVVGRFSETSDNLSVSAKELYTTTEQTNEGIMKQQSEIDLVASAVTEMSSTVQEVARNVENAAHDAEEADSQAVQGQQIVQKTMKAIEDLAGEIERAADVINSLQQESDNIGSVLDVIGGIAEQTNLLALNAAIEAARAGEQGRGFAVVADEVRTLASRTQSSTQEIQEMIERLQAGAKEAVAVMKKGREQVTTSVGHAEDASASLQNITSAVTVIKEMSQQIASASREQSSVTEEIHQNVISIAQVANQTSSDSKKIAGGSNNLSSLSTELNSLISQFKL